MVRVSLAPECCIGPASGEGTARGGLCAKAGICDIVFSGHRWRPTIMCPFSNGHGGRSARSTASRQWPGGASRLQLALHASSLCLGERFKACASRSANRRSAIRIARNPDPVSVMKAPWLDHRSRLARRSVIFRYFRLSRPCLALPGRRTLELSRRPNVALRSLSAHPPRKRRPAENRHGVPASHLDDEPSAER